MLINIECQMDEIRRVRLTILYKFKCEYSFNVFIQYHTDTLKHLRLLPSICSTIKLYPHRMGK